MLRSILRNTLALAKEVWTWDLKPPREFVLIDFANKAEIEQWETSADSKYGGRSTSTFSACEGKGIFHGQLSLDFDPDKTTFIKKSGFAGIRTKKGRLFDLYAFDTLEMRMKGDGRSYVTTLRTHNFVDNMNANFEENTWQAFINTKADEWKVYKIPFSSYRKSWEGRLLAWDCKLNRRNVVGMGFHAVARTHFGKLQPPGPGPFKLEIEWIKGVRTDVGYGEREIF